MAGDGSGETDVFDVVRDPTRMEIIRTLADAYHESPDDPWLAYGELRDEAGIRDKGNFNYHLDRLGSLIEKDAPGYRISGLGMHMAITVASGDLDTEWTWGPIEVEGECPYCDDPVTLRYADLGLALECESGDHPLSLAVSPRLLDAHPGDDVVERVAVVTGQRVELARRGICADCHGPLDGRIERDGNWTDAYTFHGDCSQCGIHVGHPVGMLVQGHPDVIEFFSQRGIDVRTTPFWSLDFRKAGHETAVSTDPLRVGVDIECEGETLSLLLDREASVVSVDRPSDHG